MCGDSRPERGKVHLVPDAHRRQQWEHSTGEPEVAGFTVPDVFRPHVCLPMTAS